MGGSRIGAARGRRRLDHYPRANYIKLDEAVNGLAFEKPRSLTNAERETKRLKQK
jgi:hypothetical protein